MYSLVVSFTAKAMQKFNFDKFIKTNFGNYQIMEYSKNEKGYYVELFNNELATTDISNLIKEIADILDQENNFNKDLVEILSFKITV